MKIWILNHYASTPDTPGGDRHYALARGLGRQGYEVGIFASSFSHYQHRETKLVRGEQWRLESYDGVQFVWLRTGPYQANNWRRVLSWYSYLRTVLSVGPRLVDTDRLAIPDVVIGSSVHLFAVYAAYRLANRFSCPFVAEIRDLWPQTLVDMGKLTERHPLAWALRRFERFLYARADKIIMLLPMAYKYTNAMGIPAEKIAWIPNGVDLSSYSTCGTDDHREGDGPFTVMYAGAHGRANALTVVLEAARVLLDRNRSDIRFVFVGDGPEKASLVRRKEDWRLSNVEFRAPVARSRLPQVLAKADAFVHVLADVSLYKYGMSMNKSYDYLAAMRPVLLAGHTANNYVKEAGCGLTTPPNDPHALAEAIIELADMPKEAREAMARRGRAYVEQHHDYSVLASRLADLLEELTD